MEWYWIILIGIGYLTMGGIVAVIADYLNNGIDEDLAAALVLFWPIMISILLWICLIFGIIKGCEFGANKLFYAFTLLIGKIKSRQELRKAKKASCSQYKNIEEPDSIIDDIDYVCPEKLRRRRVSSSFISTGK